MQIKEYKLLSQNTDFGFNARDNNPEELEKELNSYAEQGWRVVASFRGTFNNYAEKFVIILERDINKD